MPKAAQYRLTWHDEQQVYELREHPGGHLLTVPPGEQAWFAWLDTIPSFTFWGKLGHLTVRKESRQWGEGYWYAYRRVGPKLTKKYLGRTANLTLACLEETAALLSGAEVSPPEEAAVQIPSDEMVPDRQRSRGAVEVDIPAVGADVIISPSARPGIQGDPLLTTKLHRPRPRSRLVSRSHLVEQLQQGREHALTLVSAPAGFGKTTLLAQWLAESDTPVAWLSLEPEDNDPIRFLIYLVAALQTVDARLGTTAFELLRSPQPPPLQTVVALLTNDLLRSTVADVILVLDDYHVITAESIHRAMVFLLEHLPPQLHLVFASRADPPFPLARLRARGQLTEVRVAELRLSAAETETFLQEVMGLELPPDAVAAIERRTEGWVAGLQLAALSLRGRMDVSAFLAGFTGSHRFILDYLSEEVLSRQPIPLQSFLLHTSILDRLTGSLCDAVTGQQGSQEMLEALERANLFLVSLDDERRWYRYHRLFADVLLSHLQHTQPAIVPELHRRASLWYEQQGLAEEAILHALAPMDFERAAGLIEKNYSKIALRGKVQTTLGWMKALPDELVCVRPSLCIYYADLLMFTHQMEAAEARLQDAEQYIEKNADMSQRRRILGQAATIRAIIARYSGDLERSVSLGYEALNLLLETEVDWRGSAWASAAHSYLVSGDVTLTSERPVVELVALVQSSDDLFLTMRSITLLARLQVLRGQLREAAATYDKTRRLVPEQQMLQALTGGAAYYFGMGDVLREWNKLDDAERFLTAGMELIRGELTVFADEVTLGYMALARLQFASGDFSRAMITLDTFERVARQRRFVAYLVECATAMKAQLELVRGNLASAAHWADESGLSIHDEEPGYLRERAYLALARVRIAQGRDDPAAPFLRDALHLLDRLLQDAEAKERMNSVLEILVLRALALESQGNRTGALSTLERALMLAEPEGYVRLFVDEGTPMRLLLREAQARGIVPEYVATLLAAFGEQAAPRPPSQAGSLIEPLTEREREVLRLLLEGASNREIAHRLVLSINTVKRHIYNICGKLGVQSRTQAIVKARALDLS